MRYSNSDIYEGFFGSVFHICFSDEASLSDYIGFNPKTGRFTHGKEPTDLGFQVPPDISGEATFIIDEDELWKYLVSSEDLMRFYLDVALPKIASIDCEAKEMFHYYHYRNVINDITTYFYPEKVY